MPRDGSGNYTLPAGVNPVVSGTTIDVAWANPTASDIATALTDSLSRTGSGGMLVPFLNADGAIGAPGISWVNEPSMGIYRPNANEMRSVMVGVDRTRWVDNVNPLQVWIVSDASWRPLLNTFNPYTIVGDWTYEGRLVTDDSTTARAGFNIPLGVEPTVPVEGDMWKTAANAFIFTGGVAQSIIGATGLAVSTQASSILRGDGVGGWVENTVFQISAAGDATLQESRIAIRSAAFDTAILFADVAGANGLVIFGTGTGSVETQALSGGGTWTWGTTVRFEGDTDWLEQASTAGPPTGFGRFWLRNDVPPMPMYTDDTSVDFTVGITQVFNNFGDQQTVNNSTTPVTIPQLSGMVLAANAFYTIEIQLKVNQASITPDLLLRLDGSGTILDEDWRVTSISQLTNAFTFQDSQSHTVLGAVQDQTGNHCYQAIGFVATGNAGTWNLQFAQQNAIVANTIVDDASWVRVTRIG